MAEVILGNNVTKEQRRVCTVRRDADATGRLQLADRAADELLKKRSQRLGLSRRETIK
jgi:hypothetical protein